MHILISTQLHLHAQGMQKIHVCSHHQKHGPGTGATFKKLTTKESTNYYICLMHVQWIVCFFTGFHVHVQVCLVHVEGVTLLSGQFTCGPMHVHVWNLVPISPTSYVALSNISNMLLYILLNSETDKQTIFVDPKFALLH